MADARTVIDPTVAVGVVDERVFGSFVEHMGRAVYGGIYEPGHPTADADGWRHDVIDLVRQLGSRRSAIRAATSSRGTTGRMASDRARARPERHDLAWRSIEPNLVGTDEFVAWAGLAGADADARREPRDARRRGRSGPRRVLQRARRDGRRGPARRQRPRRAIRHPHVVPRQRDGRPVADRPHERGRVRTPRGRGRARDAPRRPDRSSWSPAAAPDRRCPRSARGRTTVLELAGDVVDHISLHAYYDPAAYETVDDYLACSADLDRMIVTVAGDRRCRHGASGKSPTDRPERRRMERLAPGGASRARGDASGPRVRAGARAGRGHARPGRRAGRRLPVDHAATACRPRLDRVPGPAGQCHPGHPHHRRAARHGSRLRPIRSRMSRAGAGGRCCSWRSMRRPPARSRRPRSTSRVRRGHGVRRQPGRGAGAARGRAPRVRPPGGGRADGPHGRGPRRGEHGGRSLRIVSRPATGATIVDERLSVPLPARSWNVVRLATPG